MTTPARTFPLGPVLDGHTGGELVQSLTYRESYSPASGHRVLGLRPAGTTPACRRARDPRCRRRRVGARIHRRRRLRRASSWSSFWSGSWGG